MEASRSCGSSESYLNLTLWSDAPIVTSDTMRAPEQRWTTLLTRAVFFSLGLLLLGMLAQPSLRGQTAYFSGAVTSLGGEFYYAFGVAVDQSGNVYVADSGSNAVKVIPPGCTFYSCVTTLGGNFRAPNGVALDAIGNLYVADSLNDVVKEMPASCTASAWASGGCVITTLGGGFSEPFGVGVDKNGNVYVADTGNGVVKEMPPNCTSAICVTTLGGGSGFPTGVAVDGSGNVYVADTNLALYEMPPGCTLTNFQAQLCSATKLGGGIGAQGVAIDGKGNVYVADTDGSAVRDMPPNCTSASCVTTLGGGFGAPSGIAVDQNGNVYVGIQSSATVPEIMTHGVNFGTVAVGSTGPTLTLYFTFTSSDSDITASVVTQGAVGLDFVDAKTGSCYTNALVPGGAPSVLYSATQTCTVNVTFNPKYSGARYGAVQLSDATGVIATAYIYGTGQGPQLAFASGTIGTIAGNGMIGYGGDGGAATSAELEYPAAVAVDSAGNVFIADYGNNRIREVNPSTGIINTVAGTGTLGYSGDGGAATGAELYQPTGVALDGAGNLYIADQGNNRVREVNASTGIITTAVGNGAAGYGGDGGAAISAELSDPKDVAVDGAGNLYIVDRQNSRIRRVSASTGIITTVAGNGIFGYSGDGAPATGAELNPNGVAVDGAGNIYIADAGNNRIREVNPSTGIINTVAGTGTLGYSGDGEAATGAELNGPFRVAVDGAGNVYIADYGNSRIREVNASTGIITTAAGTGTPGYSGDGGPDTGAELSYPGGLALDGAGNVYISDTSNDRIREVNVSAASLSFANTNVGSQSSDSPETITLQNIGNAPLTFPVPGTGENPSVSANFALDSSTNCPEVRTSSSPGTLAAGATCILAVNFLPTAAGSINGTAVLTDNSLNVTSAMQTINLSGTGLSSTVSVSIGTNPGGLTFSINGTPYSTTQIPSLNIGTQYTLSTTSPQAGGPGVQYVFAQWSDGTTSLTDQLMPTASTSSDAAQFTAQYVLTVTANAGGTIGPSTTPNGFYNPATLQPITAMPNAGYYFVGWSGANSPGDIASATSATTFVTMNGPENLTANFVPIPNLQVTTLNDDATGNASNCSPPSSNCSLRDAITAIEANNGSMGSIAFASGLTGIIALTSALPSLNGQITIAGPGASNLTVSGGNAVQVFSINSGAVSISGLTIANGASVNGGGIANDGSLTVTNSTFTGNTASTYGGAIYSGPSNPLVVTGSTFFGNSAGTEGGGLYGGGGTFLTVSDSTFSGNSAGFGGGGIYWCCYYATVSNTTISDNTAKVGGGFYNNNGNLTINNSIVAGNTTSLGQGDDCDGCGTQSGYNLISTQASIINPQLAPLGNYGGLTQTMLPLPGSAAICAASSALVPAGVTTDQRGYPNTNTVYAGYSSNSPCVDAGAVQTNYQSVQFTNAGSGFSGTVNQSLSPAPVVSVTENGQNMGGIPITLGFSGTGTANGLGPVTTVANTGASFKSVSVNLAGSDTLSVSIPVVGSYSLSTSNPLSVILATTANSVASSINPSVFGQQVSFTVSVTSGTGTPTGTVTLYDGGAALGSASLTGGSAVLTIGTLTAGSHSITATYAGDSGHSASGSTPISQSVSKASTTIALTSSQTLQVPSASVTFTAMMTGQYSGPISGSVVFKSGTTTLGTVPVTGSQASLTTSFAKTGTYSMTAQYSGDVSNSGSASAALSESIVSKFPTTATLTSSPNPSLVSQKVTLTATVTSPGGSPPNGELMNFRNGGSSLGTAPLNNGVAQLSVSTLAAGSDNLTAVYSADATFNGSTSAALTQQINKNATSTGLNSNLNPSTHGQAVTLEASVTSAGPTPTGSVTFKDGSTILATIALSGGVATYSRTTFTSGTHLLTATYAGDLTSATSSSSTLSQVVNQAITTTAIASSNNPSKFGRNVTFTATVSSPTATPTGSVTFTAGTIVLGTITLNNLGVAKMTISTLPRGTSTVTASYPATTNFTSSSVSVNQTVN